MESTVFPAEAPVKSVNADLFHAVLARAVIESSLHWLASGVLQDAGFLQLVLVVQESVHELLHLQDVSAVSAANNKIQSEKLLGLLQATFMILILLWSSRMVS